MSAKFRPATRQKARLRMALDGPAKSGKTFTSLRFAFAFGGRVAVIDSENGSASKYQGYAPDGTPFEFDVLELSSYSPADYAAAVEDAGREGYSVLVIDSLSHAWAGKDGALEIKDRQGGNQFTAWAAVTPVQNRMVHAILTSPCHVIATMRSKMKYVLEADEKGKQVPRAVGLDPVQRDGIEYEFDIYASIDHNHVLNVHGSRCDAVDHVVVPSPGAAFMRPVIEWLNVGVAAPPVELPKRISEEQLARLSDLARQLKLTPVKIAVGLTPYRKSTFSELLAAEADEVDSRLRAKLQPASPPSPTPNGSSIPPSAPTPEPAAAAVAAAPASSDAKGS